MKRVLKTKNNIAFVENSHRVKIEMPGSDEYNIDDLSKRIQESIGKDPQKAEKYLTEKRKIKEKKEKK